MLFVDYNQNARDHTIASAYSVRGVPEAPYPPPSPWDEIDEVDPRQFTIVTVPARFAKLGDLQGIDDSAYPLDTLLGMGRTRQTRLASALSLATADRARWGPLLLPQLAPQLVEVRLTDH
jgi:DNA primase